MSADCFTFRQFVIRQDNCAMKVGTDGTLLGAWAAGVTDDEGCPDTDASISILDIGTGTGLIALMMAQRFPNASVIGIDIDDEAVRQAQENAEQSPFHERISFKHIALQDYPDVTDYGDGDDGKFDVIVCNPPFFENALVCPDRQRTAARHTSALPFQVLMKQASSLLKPCGVLSVIIPTESKGRIEEEAAISGLCLYRSCAVFTKKGKTPKRYLLEFTVRPRPICRTEIVIGSDDYKRLTDEFYLPRPMTSQDDKTAS